MWTNTRRVSLATCSRATRAKSPACQAALATGSLSRVSEGRAAAKPNECTMKACDPATAALDGSREGSDPAGGGDRSPWTNSMPDCSWVRPVHSSDCTGNDTLGKPTSTVSGRPRRHSA